MQAHLSDVSLSPHYLHSAKSMQICNNDNLYLYFNKLYIIPVYGYPFLYELF
jgi:hypothetical protein